MRQSPGRDRVMVLVIQAEDAPQTTNRVDLDPAIVDLDGLPVARCTYQNHAFELDAGTFYEPKLLDILQARGRAATRAIAPRDAIPSSQHIMGTLRFGADADDERVRPERQVLGPRQPLRERRRAVPDVERLQPDDDDRDARAARRRGDGQSGLAELGHRSVGFFGSPISNDRTSQRRTLKPTSNTATCVELLPTSS